PAIAPVVAAIAVIVIAAVPAIAPIVPVVAIRVMMTAIVIAILDTKRGRARGERQNDKSDSETQCGELHATSILPSRADRASTPSGLRLNWTFVQSSQCGISDSRAGWAIARGV